MRGSIVGLVAVLSAFALSACELGDETGGGPGFGPEQTVTFASTDTLDGWARSDATGNAGTASVVVGDLESAGVGGHRGFYSFNITAIPAGSLVTSATLQVYQITFTGAPYTDLGVVIVDHVDYGTTLDVGDFGATALSSNIGTISSNGNQEAKTLGVAGRVQADVSAGRPRSQFRMRFSNLDSNSDGGADIAQFGDAEYGVPAARPQLTVKYRPPVTP